MVITTIKCNTILLKIHSKYARQQENRSIIHIVNE